MLRVFMALPMPLGSHKAELVFVSELMGTAHGLDNNYSCWAFICMLSLLRTQKDSFFVNCFSLFLIWGDVCRRIAACRTNPYSDLVLFMHGNQIVYVCGK